MIPAILLAVATATTAPVVKEMHGTTPGVWMPEPRFVELHQAWKDLPGYKLEVEKLRTTIAERDLEVARRVETASAAINLVKLWRGAYWDEREAHKLTDQALEDCQAAPPFPWTVLGAGVGIGAVLAGALALVLIVVH